VPGLDESKLRALAEDAKKNCPVSKLLNADMDLTVHAGAEAAS
jgi:osmotically inducible protein OsmC